MTPRQHQALDFIRVFIAQRGVSPTYDEIGAEIGINRSGVHRVVHALIDRGYITSRPGHPRSIRLAGPASGVVGHARPVVDAARVLLNAILWEDPDRDVVVVPASVVGDLDLALSIFDGPDGGGERVSGPVLVSESGGRS